MSGFETGEYDIAGEIPTENFHDFDGNDDVKLYTHTAGVLTAFFNMNEGIFADEAIRKCAFMAIDCKAAALAAYGEEELFTIDPNLGNPENDQWATDAGKKYFNQAYCAAEAWQQPGQLCVTTAGVYHLSPRPPMPARR